MTLGDYLPGSSDVDLLVVVDEPLTDRQLAALTEAAAGHRLGASGAGSGVQVERRHPGERDLVVEFSMCRAHGRSLVGAAPAELLGEVPAEWVLADWEAIGDDPKHAQLTVLTACRVWRYANEGRHRSKTAAGEWALGREPTLQVVRDALHQRHRNPTAPIDRAQVAQLLAVVRARLDEARNARG